MRRRLKGLFRVCIMLAEMIRWIFEGMEGYCGDMCEVRCFTYINLSICYQLFMHIYYLDLRLYLDLFLFMYFYGLTDINLCIY